MLALYLAVYWMHGLQASVLNSLLGLHVEMWTSGCTEIPFPLDCIWLNPSPGWISFMGDPFTERPVLLKIL